MKHRVKNFQEFVNEGNIFTRARDKVKDWNKKGHHANLWAKHGDQVRNWVADQHGIEDFGYDEGYKTVEESPFTVQFMLYVYDEDGRGGRYRSFNYTFPEGDSKHVDIKQGSAKEVDRS